MKVHTAACMIQVHLRGIEPEHHLLEHLKSCMFKFDRTLSLEGSY